MCEIEKPGERDAEEQASARRSGRTRVFAGRCRRSGKACRLSALPRQPAPAGRCCSGHPPHRAAAQAALLLDEWRYSTSSAGTLFVFVRTECLDWLLILGCRHLERVLRIYTTRYNSERPHRGRALQPPDPRRKVSPSAVGKIGRRDRLGGLIHDYYRTAA
jgi:hypothetical protein